MSKLKISIFFVLLTCISFLLSNCKHEIPVSCEKLGFKISATKTDALLSTASGTISVTATGGEGFKYNLNGGTYQDSGYFAGLAPFAEYKIVGRNAACCTDTATINIGSFNPCDGVVIQVATTKVDAGANQSNGSITAVATPGTGFTYSINGGAFQATGVFANLAAGNYTVAAKSTNGCLGTSQVTIATIDPCAGITVAVTTTVTQPTLNQSNGSIAAAATGGTGFTFSINGGAFQASGTFGNLAAGSYTITAKNSNGCTGVNQASLAGTDPCAGITVAVTSTQVDPTTAQSNGSITAGATGGSGFTYSLNGGVFQAGNTFSGLATGNYTLTAKNSNGCTGVKTVSLGANNPCAGITVVVTTSQVNPLVGQSTGSITAAATGGSGFTYSLNNGAYQTDGTFSNLAAGVYTITAKNSSGCLGTKQTTLTATDPCAGITVAVAATQVNPTTGQSNGSITATATGGSGFTFSVNNGAFQASGTFSTLAAGSYTITAKNSNGCTGTKTVTLAATSACSNVTITVTAAVVNTIPCTTPANNGSITITATGSTGFTYNNNGGSYQAASAFSSLTAGSYLIGVKDANGCTATKTVTVAAVAAGTTFAAVKALITSRCSGGGCHTSGGSAAGYNFDTDCKIVGYWNQINGACVTGALKKMPLSPQAALTAAEKTTITNWINAGHTFDK